VIEDPRTAAADREKQRLVIHARDYAQRVLKLDVGNSFKSHSSVESDTLLLVV
jgi:hypothetical protein